MDLHRGDYTPDQTFQITVENHQFNLPSAPMVINCDELVMFDVTSNDLTYGFGLFRSDWSMLFQMQVVPGHRNDILWQFSKNGVYTIRSTEYSGPRGVRMIEEDAVEEGRGPPHRAARDTPRRAHAARLQGAREHTRAALRSRPGNEVLRRNAF